MFHFFSICVDFIGSFFHSWDTFYWVANRRLRAAINSVTVPSFGVAGSKVDANVKENPVKLGKTR